MQIRICMKQCISKKWTTIIINIELRFFKYDVLNSSGYEIKSLKKCNAKQNLKKKKKYKKFCVEKKVL